MARKHYSIDQLSTATSRQAQTEAAMMQRELRRLRDSIANASRSIREPVIRASRKKTKKTTNTSSFGTLLDMFGNAATGELLGVSSSHASSAAQKAESTLLLLALGQRIR